MTISAIDVSVYRELWISLVSLIRSYAAGYDFGGSGSKTEITGAGDGSIVLHSAGKVLRIEFDPASGQGKWSLTSNDAAQKPQQGTYFLELDSTIRFSDRMGKLELDVAAEAFTARILDL